MSASSTDSTRSVVTGSVATLLGTAISSLLAVAYISFGARWLGPEDYGQVAAAVSTANIFFLALNPLEAGLTLRIAGYGGRAEPGALADFLARALRSMTLLAGAILTLWISAGAALRASGAMQWLGVFCCASLVGNLPRAALRGGERLGALAFNWILEGALRMSVGLALVELGLGPAGMVAGYAAGIGAATLHAAVYARSGLPAVGARGRFALADLLLPMRSLSAPLLGLHVYTALVVNADVLAASRYLSASEAGVYGGAASIARIVLVGANPLLLVLFSRLATLNAAREDTRHTQLLGAAMVVGGLALSLLIPAFAAELVLGAFLGPAYAHAGHVLLLQWTTACVLIAQAFFAESMLATSRVRGGWLCVAPAAVLVACLAIWHDSAETIARTALLVCASLGTATFLLLWRWRTRLEV